MSARMSQLAKNICCMCKPARLAMTPKSTTCFLASFILLFGLMFFPTLAARASPGDTLSVQAKSMTVYEAPGANAPVVMQVNQGQKLKELRRQGGWVKVIIYGTLGKEGWVEESLIGHKPLAGTTAERQGPEEDTIIGARELRPKPKAKSLLHNFTLRVSGSGRIKGHCRYKTANGAISRFKIDFVNRSYQIKAKAIRCNVSSPSIQARLTVQLWEDGYLLGSETIRSGSGAKSIPCGKTQHDRYVQRTCAQSTRRQLSAHW